MGIFGLIYLNGLWKLGYCQAGARYISDNLKCDIHQEKFSAKIVKTDNCCKQNLKSDLPMFRQDTALLQ